MADDPDAKTATADPDEDYIRRLEKEYDQERPIRKFFARMPRSRVLRRNIGGGPVVTVTINRAPGQTTPTRLSPINFTIVFSQPVTGFIASDVSFTGSSIGGLSGTLSGTGPTYNLAVTGMTGQGSVVVNIPKDVAFDAATGKIANSPSNFDIVTYDAISPSVTIVPAVGQLSPTSTAPITYTVSFNEDVTGFLASDVTVSFTGGGTPAKSLSGVGPSYNIEVTGMTTSGNVTASVPAGAAADFAGNLSLASPVPATVVWDTTVVPPSSIAQTYFYIAGQY